MAAALPFIALGASVLGTAVQGIAKFQQDQYQSAVAKNNAVIADKNAQRVADATQVEQMRSDREYASQEAAATAAQSASGLDVLGHSQLAVRSNIAEVRGEQATDIRQKGAIDVSNFYQQQANFLGEERAAKTNAWMGLAATAFSITSTVASNSHVQSAFGGSKTPTGSLVGSSKSTGK